jgi:photosystem II stability/assembly factor-like uncharacterized protein
MRKSLVLFSILSVALTVFSTSADAAWTRAGLFGADVRALVIDPKDPDVIYLGTSQGEIYASSDGGRSWKNPRKSVPFPGHVVDNLVVDRAGNLWAAAWGLWGGGVVAVSPDGGVTWERRDKDLGPLSVHALAVYDKDENIVVAGGLTGVHKSTDAGKSWTKISDRVNVDSLGIDPRSSDTIYVGTYRQAWRSDDGGKTWKHIDNGMVLDTDVFAIRFNPKNPDQLWLATCGWVYDTKNRGDLWTRYRDGFNNRRIHDINIDPRNDSIVYAASVAGLYRTVDAGKNWALISDEDLVVNSIGLHKERPNRIVLGTEGDGVYISEDGGKSFERSNQGLYNVKVAAVVSDPERKKRLFAAVYFGGAASGIYESENGGQDWRKLSKTRLPQILSLIVQKETSPRFLAGTEKGFYWSEDGVEWQTAEPLIPVRVEKILTFSPVRLFAATSEGVFTSRDSGKRWYRLAGLDHRTSDIAVGRFGGKHALYAMTTRGLSVFDGEKWFPIEGSPESGRQVAVRNEGVIELVVIGSQQGVRAGTIDAKGRWKDAKLPAGNYVDVHQAGSRDAGMMFLAARERKDLMVKDSGAATWRAFPSPLEPTAIMGISSDSFDPNRFYVGTLGQGIFIFNEGVPAATQSAAPAAGLK